MPRRKRAAEETAEGSTKTKKAARTEKNGDRTKRGAKKATGATLSGAEFKAKALPLHLNLTHTPPTISNEEGSNEKDNDEAALENATTTGPSGDAGFIGNLTLVPSVFSTGSYGWKGNKRLTIELQDGDTDAEGGKDKVQIMLTVNATVVGSKHAKSAKGKEEEEREDVAEEAEQGHEDVKED